MGDMLEHLMTIFEGSSKLKGIRSQLPELQTDPAQKEQLDELNKILK
jgi:hypothetical protein